MPTITIQQRARNVQILLKRYGGIQDDVVSEHLRELLAELTSERPCFDVEPGTLIHFKDVGIQVRAGYSKIDHALHGQPYVTVNTEELDPLHTYGEDNGMPAIAVHLNDAVLFDDTGNGNTASVVGTPMVYVVRPGDMSEDVAVFGMERHAQAFRDTYDDGDCGEVESAIVCDHDLMLALVKERRAADLEIDMRVQLTGTAYAHDYDDTITMENEPATVVDLREGVDGYVCRVDTDNYGVVDVPARGNVVIEVQP